MTGAGAIHALPVPTPFAVGRINCYLVEDDPLTLVDAGPNSATSLTVLEAALGEHGRRIEDLERIVITHQHIDHIGLVQILADRSGAEVARSTRWRRGWRATRRSWRPTTPSPRRSCCATVSRRTSSSRCGR